MKYLNYRVKAILQIPLLGQPKLLNPLERERISLTRLCSYFSREDLRREREFNGNASLIYFKILHMDFHSYLKSSNSTFLTSTQFQSELESVNFHIYLIEFILLFKLKKNNVFFSIRIERKFLRRINNFLQLKKLK